MLLAFRILLPMESEHHVLYRLRHQLGGTIAMIRHHDIPESLRVVWSYVVSIMSFTSLLCSLQYHWLGPTTIHLRYELCLLISLTLLTCSSLHGLYKDSFGMHGDYLFVAMVFFFLSRHIVLRWLCTWDYSTHARCTGLLSHFLTAHVSAGHAVDRPNLAAAKVLGIHFDDKHISAAFASSLIHAWYVGKNISIYICNQMLGLRIPNFYSLQQFPFHVAPSKAPSLPAWWQASLKSASNKLLSLWISYGPSLQFAIPSAIISFYLWRIYSSFMQPSWKTPLIPISLSMGNTAHLHQDMDVISPRGHYDGSLPITWWHVWCTLSQWPVFLTAYLFARVMTPWPDLVLARPKVKKLKKGGGGGAYSAATGVGGGGGGAGSYATSATVPWAEQFYSLAAQDRFQLTGRVLFARLIEILWVCWFLPRTGFICRASQHCSLSVPLWKLSRLLFPAGVTKAFRDDNVGRYDGMERDAWSAIGTVVSVTLVTVVLLGLHYLSLNRTFFAVYVAKDWIMLPDKEKANHHDAVLYDPTRKYRKGDVVMVNDCYYRAVVLNPESRPPRRRFVYRMQQLISRELGPSSASQIALLASLVQLGMGTLYALLWLRCVLTGLPRYGLAEGIIAHLVAGYGASRTGLMNYNELSQLSKEIAGS